MPRKGTKRGAKQVSSTRNIKQCAEERRPLDDNCDVASNDPDQEVERRVSAIRAIRDVQIEHLVTELRLLRSCISEEHMGIPALQFFTENLPNLSFIQKTDDGQLEVQWEGKHGKLCPENADGRTLHSSLLRRMSLLHPDSSIVFPYLGNAGLLSTEDLHVRDFVLQDPSDCQMLGLQDTLRTPGLNSQRLSIGMTPKTLRLPKPGEMLLSVHGSPLGVYKEENMEAINESDEV